LRKLNEAKLNSSKTCLTVTVKHLTGNNTGSYLSPSNSVSMLSGNSDIRCSGCCHKLWTLQDFEQPTVSLVSVETNWYRSEVTDIVLLWG